MKEFIAEPGGRYTYADDIINLQDMVLAVGSLLDGCSNFIVSGCQCQGAVITPGYVWLGDKIRRFEGCADASYPYYIYEKNSNESVTYANEVNKRGRACYLASGGRSVPDTVDSVTGALPQYIEVTADYAPRLADKFFGRYALMTDSPFARQTVRKDLLLTGTLTVEKGIESKHSLLVSPTGSKKILRGYFSEASVARLEAGTNATPTAAVVFDLLKGRIIIESKGVVAATFTERLCTLSDLRSDTVRAGSLYLTGNQLKNIAERSDKGTVRINYDGYNEGTAYFRNFEVYDGKRCTLPLLQVCGADKRVAVHAVLAVDSAHGITLSDADHVLTDAAFGGVIRWCDLSGAEAAIVGYTEDKRPHFSITNTAGGILLVPKNFVDVQGDLQVNGISIAKTYATQQALIDGLNKKVDAVEGKGLSTKDFTQELYDKLSAIASGNFAGEDTPQSEGYVTTTQVAAELRKRQTACLTVWTRVSGRPPPGIWVSIPRKTRTAVSAVLPSCSRVSCPSLPIRTARRHVRAMSIPSTSCFWSWRNPLRGTSPKRCMSLSPALPMPDIALIPSRLTAAWPSKPQKRTGTTNWRKRLPGARSEAV